MVKRIIGVDGLIPARNKSREMLDSVFLLKYARGIEQRAKWMPYTHGLVGGILGFVLGSVIVMVKHFMAGGLMPVLTLMKPQEPQPEVFFWVYLPWLVAAIFAVLAGARGLGKAEDMRFQSQMALHILKLHELALEVKHG
jgi:hypothetical protein